MSDELLLIDLSSIAFPIWATSGENTDPSAIKTQILSKVRQLAHAHPHAAVCLDSGKSFRHDLDPNYKANRDLDNRAVLKHQIDAACEELKRDGFPVWAVPGYEADDIIATAVRKAIEMVDDCQVLIASADKDLLQLVSGKVRTKSTHPMSNGTIAGPAEVFEKFKVQPSQMLDYLCLVGDSSDNVKGANGIGAVKAAELLSKHGSIANVYAAIDKGVANGITPSMRTSLVAFRDRWPLVRDLIALKSDAPIPFAEIATEREARPMVDGPFDDPGDNSPGGDEPTERERADAEAAYHAAMHAASAPRELDAAQATDALGDVTRKVAERIANGNAETRADIAVPAPLPVLAPRDYSQELEPRSPEEAVRMAGHLHASKLLGAYGTWQGVLLTILRGRELGMDAGAALDAFHIIDGKPRLSAGAISGLVLKFKHTRYFRCTERTAERATFETQRGDDPPISLTYTIAEAQQAWSKDERAWKVSGWGRNPADMLVARASSKLARLVYPDVVSGLYAPEEMD